MWAASPVLAGAVCAWIALPGSAPPTKPSPIGQWRRMRQATLADPSVIAYYDFQAGKGALLENHAKTGKALDGKIHGAAWTQGRWPGKGALRFDGKNDYVTIPHTRVLAVFDKAAGGTGALTVEVWVKARSGQEAGIVDKTSTGWGKLTPFGVWISSKRAMAGSGDGTAGQSVRDTVLFSLDTWTHLVLTLDRRALSLYKDGARISRRPLTISPRDNGKPLLLGCMKRKLYHYDGAMDEVIIYNRALTSSEIGKRFRSKTVPTIYIP
jgi:concanavalin A-like lectin/glucanase superfamily protein